MSKISCEILELSQQTIKFALSGCDVSLANALRRVLLSEIPTLAPHLVSVIENTSVLHDEFLVQRMGLIPFISDAVDLFKYPWECDCSSRGTQDCQVCKTHFVLQAKNVDRDVLEVTSLDIRPVYELMQSEEEERRPVVPIQYESSSKKGTKIGIPIVKLSRNQEIYLRFDVQKGIGKMHAKWSPVSLATFQPDPEIKLDETVELTEEQKFAIRDSCPTKVFQVQQGIFQVANPEKCIYCNECKMKAESIDRVNLKHFIQIGKKKERYIFTVESIGTLSPVYIVKKSMGVLREKLQSVEKAISS